MTLQADHNGRRALLAQYLFTQFAFYGLLPFLPILLIDTYGLSAGSAGTLLLVFASLVRGGSVVVGQLLENLPQKRTAIASLFATGGGLTILALVDELWMVVTALALAGLGISVGGVVVRALLAQQSSGRTALAKAFASIGVLTNIAAGVAPLLTGWLAEALQPRVLFLVSGVAYFLAGLVLFAVPGAPAPPVKGPRDWTPMRLRSYLDLLRLPAFRRLMYASTGFWFLYGQFYAALPVYMELVGRSTAQLGAVYLAESATIVALQFIVTRAILSRMGDQSSLGLYALCIGSLFFGVSFAIVPLAHPIPLAVYAAAVVFAFGVMIGPPFLDASVSDLAMSTHQITAFNARKISWGVGEGIAALVGVSVQIAIFETLGSGAYWYMVVAIAMCVATGIGLLARRLRAEAWTAG
jgi:MFS family permease